MSRSVALLSVVAAFATSAFAQAQDIHVVDVPLVTGAQIQFFRLPWPSTRFVVKRMVQDHHGFLWLSAEDGLRRYNSYDFVRVSDSQNPDSIGFIIAESMMKDRSGRIWIGAYDSLGLYDPATGSFKQYRSPDQACGTVAIAHDINEDQDGLVWLATDDGITALDPVTSKTICYRPRYDPSIGEKRVIATLPSRDGTLWITSSAGLFTLDRHSGKVTRHIQLETSSGKKFRCTGFPAKPFQDSTGMIWVGLRSGGDLARIDPVSGEITVYSFQGAGLAPNSSSGVVSIQEDQDGALWLGTNKLGLVKLTRDRKQAIWYQSNPDDPNGLGGDLVVGLYRDRENSFWSTTKAGDVYRFQPQSPGFRSYRHQRGNPHSLDEGSVTAAYVEDQNTLWIGTDRGLNRVDRRTDQVTRFDEPIFRRGVRAIAKDRRGSLWFGTGGNGLVRFDPPSGRYRIYAHMASDPRTLSYDTIGALWIDRGGTLWVATDFGLNRFDPATEEFRRYSPQPKSLTQYRSIAEEPGGALWLATSSHGLHRFDPGTGTFTTFEHSLRDQHSLGHNRVNSVHVDGSGTVWAATLRGLAKFNPRDGTFTSYDSRSGLPTDAALGILEAENGHLWVSTQDGLSRFDPRAQTFTNYHTSDGLLTDLFDVPVVATRSPSGEMFFGSHSGLVAFFPDQVTEEKFAAPVVLTDFRLFGEPVEAGKKPLKQPIWSATSLELEARSIFSFDFSALNYVDPARTRYRYRLEGLESKWNETDSSRRTVTYTTLPAGNYTLRVQARASRGDWNESRVALKIRILPPWYATWYFRSLCAAVLLTMLWLAYQRRVQQLQRKSRELRDMIETIPAMAWTARPDGSNSFVNRRWAEFTGLSADDSAASGWTDAVHPEDRQAYAADWRASLATGQPFESEARFLCVDGEYRWLLARAVPSRDAHGKIVRWYGLLADIADRKRAETELRASEQRFRTLVEFSFDVYWETDAQHRFTRQEFAEGLAGPPPPGSEIGTTRWDVPYLEPDEEAWRKHRAMLDAHLPFRDFELARPTPDGGTRYVSVSGLAVFDSTGRFLGYRGVGRDITDRKRAEQALRDSEIRFRTFVDHAADAFFMLDFERATILDVNQYACESLGYTREELIGMTPLAFDVDLNRATLESIATRAAAGETVLFNRHRHRRKDGSTFPVEVQTSVFWHGGRRFLLKVARNISDRVQAEEEHEKRRQLEADLAHINRVSMMGELAASIAHEVNQPLAGVVSNGSACLRWLAGAVPNLDEARDAARRIVRDGKRAGEVVARVRALTRRDTKATEALDLNQSIHEVLALIGDDAKRKGAIIRTQLADDLATVAGDRVQLQQVVLNLVMNAIEAMSSVERARELVITTRNDGDHVQVTVEDSGTGLDPNGVEKIFEPFYTTKASGMGMGLSVSRSIVQSHGGRLWATAKDGTGTVFHFALPKYLEEEQHAEAERA